MPMTPQVLSASTLTGDRVVNPDGEHLGEIKELMIDLDSGRVAYAVLAFGGFLGLGDKLFAIPWEALRLVPDESQFYLDVSKECLREAPGFDKDHWPEAGDREFQTRVYDYYGYEPYWETAAGKSASITSSGVNSKSTDTSPAGERYASSSGGGGMSDTDMARERQK